VLNKLSLIGLLRPFQRQYLAYCLLHWIGRVQVTVLSLKVEQKLVVSLSMTCLLQISIS